MKKVLMMVVGLALLASAAHAYGPAAYIGVYADEARLVDEFMGFGAFCATVWINPSDNGISVFEYYCGVEGAAVVASFSTVVNPALGFASGDWWQGAGIQCSCPCQNDWFWTTTLNLGLYSADPSYIVIQPHQTFGTMQAGGCDPLKTLEPLNAINKFGLTTLGVTPNESSTWGAIKSLINE